MNKCSGLRCHHCDVIWFVICVTWFEESGTASGSSHLSGHPKDPEKECITGAVCIQECF